MMPTENYVKWLGFYQNPFTHTSAENEDINDISNYFIEPEYFEDMVGNPKKPVSSILYAARGAGKTTQRLMIEKNINNLNNIITISYTEHVFEIEKKLEDVTIEYHLEYLNRLLLLSFFGVLHKNSTKKIKLNNQENEFILKLIKIYLHKTPAGFLRKAKKSLITLKDIETFKNSDFSDPIINLVESVLKSKANIDINIGSIKVDNNLKSSHYENFLSIKSLLSKIDIFSIYILIDKIDEIPITSGHPSKCYKFISPLIENIDLLDTKGLAFKFFLWDKIKPYCDSNARPDRIYSYSLKWSFYKISMMINTRVQFYLEKNQKIDKAVKLFENQKILNHVIAFSELSPRDCIWLFNKIISEQRKIIRTERVFQTEIVHHAINLFCEEKSRELIRDDNKTKSIKKISKVTFNAEYLFERKISTEKHIIDKTIHSLLNENHIKKIETDDCLIYTFSDIRLARIACSNLNIFDFFTKKFGVCKNTKCKQFIYADFDIYNYKCPCCGNILSKKNA